MHTLDLPHGNRTSDAELCHISIHDHAVVVTKDADFVNTFTVQHVPFKLLLVSTGNIKNADLEMLFAKNISLILAAFVSHDFVELTPQLLIIHR